MTTPDAARRAVGVLYGTVSRQAAMLSYINVFYVMCLISLGVCVIVLFLSKTKPGEAHVGGH